MIRWSIALSSFKFDVEHVPGRVNLVADFYLDIGVRQYPILPKFHIQVSEDSHNDFTDNPATEKGQ